MTNLLYISKSIIITHNRSKTLAIDQSYNNRLNIATTYNTPLITSLYTKPPTYTHNLYHLTAQPNHATLLSKQVFDVWQTSSTCDNYTN